MLNKKAAGCNYSEHDRQIREQFINSIDNDAIMQDIIRELMAQKNMRKKKEVGPY